MTISKKVKNYLISFLVFYLVIDWGSVIILSEIKPNLLTGLLMALQNYKFIVLILIGIILGYLTNLYLSNKVIVNDINTNNII